MPTRKKRPVPRRDELRRRRIEKLLPPLVEQMRIDGQALVSVDRVEDLELWRAAARAAGRQLGYHVRTGISVERVAWACCIDFPPMSEAEVRRRLNAAFATFPRLRP